MKRAFYFFKLLFLINCLFPTSSVFSQPTTWAQPGAHWIYNFGDGTSFSSTGVVEVKRIGDTIASGINCDVLSIHYMYMENWPMGQWRDYHDLNRYTYESNDTVYLSYGNDFEVLFVENAQAGGYWISGPDVTSSCGGDTIFIDSSEVVNISGVLLNKMYPETFVWGDPLFMPTVYFHQPIFERFGSALYFTPLPTCVICPSWGPLICYSDNSGFFYSPNPSIICPVGVAEIDLSSYYKIVVTPSITTDDILINLNTLKFEKGSSIEIVNSEGKIIGTIPLQGTTTIKYDVSKLTKGIYFIRIKDHTSLPVSKFIKI